MATLRERPYHRFNFLVDLGDGVTEGLAVITSSTTPAP